MLSSFISISEHDTRVFVCFLRVRGIRVGAGLCMGPFFITQAIARHDIPTSSAPPVE